MIERALEVSGISPERYARTLEQIRNGTLPRAALVPRGNAYTDRIKLYPKQKAFALLPHRDAFAHGAGGTGKSICHGNRTLTPTGYLPIERIRVGDMVTGSSGTATRVTGVYPQGKLPCSRVTFTDHSSVEVSDDHLWTVYRMTHGKLRPYTVKTSELRAKKKVDGRSDQLPMLSGPVNFKFGYTTRLDGYQLGYLLGNECFTGEGVDASADVADVTEIHAWIPDANKVSKGSGRSRRFTVSHVKRELTRMGLWGKFSGEKFIPRECLHASPAYRIALLQGLMDSDGTCGARNRLKFSSTSHQLAKDVQELVECLGGIASIEAFDRMAAGKGVEYSVRIRVPSWVQPFRLKRKAKRYRPGKWSAPKRCVRSVEPIGERECTCIKVDAEDSLFATEHAILTHNTELLLYLALQYVDRPDYSALVLRKTFGQLKLSNSVLDRFLRKMRGTGFHWNAQTYKATFPSGATIDFGYLENDADMWRYDSAQYNGIFVDEANQFTEDQLNFLFLRLRRVVGSGIPSRYRLFSNPGGVSHLFLRNKYIDQRLEDVAQMPFFWEDNPSLDTADYAKSLAKLNPILFRQRRYGDWYVTRQDVVIPRDTIKMLDISPLNIDLRVRFWDLAATEPKPGKDPDYVVGALLGRTSQNTLVLEDIRRGRMSPAAVEDLVCRTAESDGRDVYLRIEQEGGASGKSLVNSYTRLPRLAGYNIKGIPPGGPKLARWQPLASQARNGNFSIVTSGAWASTWLDECTNLTGLDKNVHDDQLDATSGAYNVMVQEFSGSVGVSRLGVR